MLMLKSAPTVHENLEYEEVDYSKFKLDDLWALRHNQIYQWALFNLVIGNRSTPMWNLKNGTIMQFNGRFLRTPFTDHPENFDSKKPILKFSTRGKWDPDIKEALCGFNIQKFIPAMLDEMCNLAYGDREGFEPLKITKNDTVLGCSVYFLIGWDSQFYKTIRNQIVGMLRKMPATVVIDPDTVIYCGQVHSKFSGSLGATLPVPREAELWESLFSMYLFVDQTGKRVHPQLCFTDEYGKCSIYAMSSSIIAPRYSVVSCDATAVTRDKLLIHLESVFNHIKSESPWVSQQKTNKVIPCKFFLEENCEGHKLPYIALNVGNGDWNFEVGESTLESRVFKEPTLLEII